MAANLVKRVTSALLMVLILVGCILHPISFMAMISFAIIVMVHEYYAMTVGNGCFIVQKTLAALSILAAFLLHFFHLWLGIPANMI
ncbi:MAG: hypothetical protein HUJ90_08005, partial [Bacteroidales bacterium]|nr:hypothetical protein [Bacteroidales bacterium]